LKRSLDDKFQSLFDLNREIIELTPEDDIKAEIVQVDGVSECMLLCVAAQSLWQTP